MVLLGLDYLSVIVAQDELSTALHTGGEGLFWIVNAYTISYAGALGVAGLLVAHYGRKPIFVGGLVVFLVGALSAARAEAVAEASRIVLGLDSGQLIGLDGSLVLSLARSVQGLGAAALVSAALDRVLVFPGEKRDNAISIFSASQLLGFVLGPITGAVLLEAYGWPAIFVALAAVTVVVLVAVLASQEPEKLPREGRVDWLGAVLFMASLSLLAYGMLNLAHHGVSTRALATTSVGAVALAGFIVWELVCKSPGYDLSLLRNARLRVACVLHGAFWGSLVGTALLLGWYMLVGRKYPNLPPDQLVPLILERGLDEDVPGGFGALDAGVLVLGLGVGAVPGVILAKLLKHRTRAVLATSSALVVTANVWWSRVDLTTPKWAIFCSFVVCGAGVGAGITSVTRVAMSVAPHEEEGLSARERVEVRRKIASISTMFRTSGQVGGAIGTLMMATTGRLGYRIDEAVIAGLSESDQKAGRAGMVDAAIRARDTLNLDLYEAARRAYVPAMSHAMLVGAAMAALCMA
ncbi:MAG: MFS transporter, partial [Candidatus Rokuibacteriota bacterium]